VFHERGTMEAAVRALVAEGIPPTRIRIDQGALEDSGNRKHVRKAPESGGILGFGFAFGAASGALAALMWMYLVGRLVAIPLPMIALRTLGGAAMGSILGALLSVIVFASSRKVADELTAKAGDFVVTVKPANDSMAQDVRDFLALRGGHALPLIR
jgi:hypothetical protein